MRSEEELHFFSVHQFIVQDLESELIELDQLAEHVKTALKDFFGPREVDG